MKTGPRFSAFKNYQFYRKMMHVRDMLAIAEFLAYIVGETIGSQR